MPKINCGIAINNLNLHKTIVIDKVRERGEGGVVYEAGGLVEPVVRVYGLVPGAAYIISLISANRKVNHTKLDCYSTHTMSKFFW